MGKYSEYVGRLFDRRYKIEEVIGSGGMAVVFRAFDTLMSRTVAVKMLREEFADDEGAVRRFINESKAVAMLSHQNIVNIYDVSVRDNLKFIVMEYIEGITLKSYMSEHGRLSFSEICNFTEQILAALDHAHSRGVVHRDIKPQNIMILDDGSIKVTDFGIAKLPSAQTVTETDKAIGTVYYISPEQASGRKVDARSDIYSLGALLYELATGTLPFDSENTVSIALMQINNAPKKPRDLKHDIPVGLETLILTAMEKNPADRFDSAARMLHYLQKMRKHPGRPIDLTKDTARIRKKGGSMLPIILGVLSAFFLCLIVAGIVVVNTLFFSGKGDARVVSVENCVGAICSTEFIESLGPDYTVDIIEVHDSSIEKGYIISQSPAPYEERRIAGTQTVKLVLTVSLGAQQSVLKNYTLWDSREAEIELRSAGFGVKILEQAHPTIPDGLVISTHPIDGVTINKGDVIILYVSSGETVEYTYVPDLLNKNEADAYNLLLQSKIGIGTVSYVRSTKPAGTVISQSIKAGDRVPVTLTKINVVISGGPNYTDPTAGN
ncbi:MAG: protein kinase [Clostridia bacterium]|nr:protein kinase [Clostridia bacterium]